MLLLEPGHTAYDLHFRIAGIPVRVHPMFWLVNAIMGFQLLNAPSQGFILFTIWVACYFFSILIHEIGHIVMGRLCGSDGKIVLYAFGGLAIPDRYFHNRWQRIAVSLAGPLAEFLLIAVVALIIAINNRDNLGPLVDMVRGFVDLEPISETRMQMPFLAAFTVSILLWINLFWAALNLLPIWPLDGGHISKDLLDGARPGGQGIRTAYGISLVLAALLTIHCIASANGHKFIPFLPAFGGIFAALLFGSLAVQSWQLLQQERNPPWRREDW
jgi:stage IV sporulation protein FB